MAAVVRKKPASAAQVKAGQRYAAAGRSAQAKARAAAIAKTGKPPPRTKAQKAATAKFAAAGAKASRAAAAARRAGKTPVKSKTAQAPYLQPGFLLHLLPACAHVALAEHLYGHTGICLPDDEIIRELNQSGPFSLPDLLERAWLEGFCELRLKTFHRCDPDLALPGMLCGLQVPGGYHAVLAHPAGMLSWGRLLRWPGAPAEAWYAEWEAHERAAR